MVIDRPEELKIVETGDVWTSVTTKGMPVWVHSNFIELDSDNTKTISNTNGIVTADQVNTRTEPEITNDNIVGRLNIGESIKIIGKRPPWYQAISPARFIAWVKTSEFEKRGNININSPTTEKTFIEKVPVTADISTLDNTQNGWLFRQNKDYYTLQLASIYNADQVPEFLEHNNLSGNSNLRRIDDSSNGTILITFLYGVYTDKITAQNIRQSINQPRALIRTWGELQRNRCFAWKAQRPSPPELNQYCN